MRRALIIMSLLGTAGAVAPVASADAARFRLVKARVDGTITVRHGGDETFTADGTSRYVVKATKKGKPFALKRSTVVGGAGPVTWTASTTARWSDGTVSEDCGRTADPSAAPATFGGAFTPSADGRSVSVQWPLVNEGWACPTGIFTLDPLPLETQTSEYPMSRFARSTVTLPIKIDHRWRPDDSTDARVTWTGSVTLRRVR